MKTRKNVKKLPGFFKPLFWSVDFDSLDLNRNKKAIILSAINYGDLKHWQWISEYYGKDELKMMLRGLPATELKPRAGKLAEILFNFNLNYAPRSINRKRH